MKQFQRLAIFVTAVVALCPVVVRAQAAAPAEKPNFSGRWRMVKEKSNFGSFPVPDIVVQVVEQRGTTMNVHTVETTGKRTSTVDVSYFLDGSISNNLMNGRPADSKAFWDGDALNVRTSVKNAQGEEVLVMEDRWEMSDGGNTLTRTSHDVTPKGSVDLTMVCEKEKTQH